MLAPMTQTNSDPDKVVTTQLRIESPLWERVKVVSARRRMSRNAYVCAAVERQVQEDEKALGLA